MISFFYLELVFSSLWWFLWLCFICVPKIYSQEISLDFSTSNNNGRSFRLSMRFFLKCVWHLVFSRQVYYAFNVHLPNSIVLFIMTKTSVYVFVLIHLLCPVFYFSLSNSIKSLQNGNTTAFNIYCFSSHCVLFYYLCIVYFPVISQFTFYMIP